ncbi:MAG: hypothetical protein WBK51_01800 [Polaromonas sp.]
MTVVLLNCKAASAVAPEPRAFTADTHRRQLKPLLDDSMQSKLERFNPEIHGGEMFAVEPIGKEFGAPSK